MSREDIATICGGIMVVVICAWAVWFLGQHLFANLKSGKTVDRTLSQVDRQDAPRMYWAHAAGYLLLIFASALIGAGMVVYVVQQVTRD